MNNNDSRKKLRPSVGFSLIEALTALFITSFVAAAICELMTTINIVSFRAQNRLSALMAARAMTSQLSREVRQACTIFFSNDALFPYGTQITISLPVMKKLQISSGTYTYIPALVSGTNSMMDRDRCTYFLKPDPAKSGSYQMWKTWAFSKSRTSDPTLVLPLGTNLSMDGKSYVVASNICGPIDSSTNRPSIFKCLLISGDPQNPGSNHLIVRETKASEITAAGMNNCYGLSLSMEVVSTEHSSIKSNIPQSVPIHYETFLRGNQLVTP